MRSREEPEKKAKRGFKGKVVRTSGEYPLSAQCATCQVLLRIPIPGHYICPRCSTILFAKGAQVTFVSRRKVLPKSES